MHPDQPDAISQVNASIYVVRWEVTARLNIAAP